MSIDQNYKAESTSIARRLGVKPKQIVRILFLQKVQPDSSGLYDLNSVAAALEALPKAEKEAFVLAQKAPENAPQGFYEGKFAMLAPYAPTDTVPEEETTGFVDAEIVIDRKLDFSTELINPIDAKEIADRLNISVRRAKEFASLAGLPLYTSVNRKQKVWERSDFEKKVSNLTHKEKVAVNLWKKQFTGGVHVHDLQMAKILQVDPNLVASIKHHYNLDRTFPVTKSMIESIAQDAKFAELVSKLTDRNESSGLRTNKVVKSNKTLYISQSELANKKSLTTAEVKALVESGVVRKEANGRILRATADSLTKAFLRKNLNAEKYVNLGQASELLKVSTSVVKKLLHNHRVAPASGYSTTYGNWVNTYKYDDVLRLKQTESYARSLELSRRRNADPDIAAKNLEIDGAKKSIDSNVVVNIRERNNRPELTTLYVGPTNSGKTYNSLQALFTEYEADPSGTYVYAGPLRMLAYEVYEKMAAAYGAENVGFITGEEQINPSASLLACTVEMAPEQGTSLVLDETHWIVDGSRGQNWTNLLIGGRYQNLHILTAAEAVDVVSTLVNDSKEIVTRTFERKTPLLFKGKMRIEDVPNKTAVVCFSRKTVYAVAHELEKVGKKVGVLYGALPLNVRKAQIEKYVTGDYDIMVTTDVIGHGINLPIDNVVFVQTEKFDGVEKRDLHTWEVAQIAGRAGRFGLSAEGSVYLMEGRDWFSSNAELITLGTKAGAGQIRTDLVVEKAVITPRFKDLGLTKQTDIMFALDSWESKAELALLGRPIAPSPLGAVKRLLRAIAQHQNTPLYPWVKKPNQWRISTEELWQVVSGPFDPDAATLPVVTDWMGIKNRETSPQLSQHLLSTLGVLDKAVLDPYNTMGDEVNPLEEAIHAVGELKMVHIMFKNAGTLLYSELLEAEDRLNEAIISTLHQLITSGSYGLCVKCSEPCSPWFRFCEDCFYERQLAS